MSESDLEDFDAHIARIKQNPRTIPPLTDERLHELAVRILPVVEQGNGKYKEMLPNTDDPLNHKWLKRTAFTWSPKTRPLSRAFKLEEVRTTKTFHDWGYFGLFKPSLAEVFACIQDQDLKGITHLSLQSDQSEGLLVRPDANNINGYHQALCTLYRRP